MRAIRFVRTGGPEVLELVEIDTPTPGAGQILIRHEAIGINFIETYQRTGLYRVKLPAIPGGEVAGRVEAVGEGVTRFSVGDRANPSGDAERDVEHPSDTRHPTAIDAPSLRACGDFVEHQLVGALVAVAFGESEDVTDDAVVAEADTFDNLAVADIKAGDETTGEHLRPPANGRASHRRTAAPAMLFR